MSLYPSTTTAFPSTTLFPEVGEQIACFDDYAVTLEAAYASTVTQPVYASTLTLPAYASSLTEPVYASTLTASYASSLTAASYQTTLEGTLDLDVTC